ncbi:protein of unknown function (plasmid) [Azospirillum lipoferum 4B]|uniref:GAF domain-containing protein n=1 Tax=Azospirillum lipoferum (strain 4B) TaxID=862719 RepID=G7ZE03_AZOL4|nr:protein of unknown function [Azospirillum lipoferum 4B]
MSHRSLFSGAASREAVYRPTANPAQALFSDPRRFLSRAARGAGWRHDAGLPGLLDSTPDPAFNELVSWACDHFQVPIALVSLLDADRQWFKPRRGLATQETPRNRAFCRFTIQQSLPMVVEDAAKDRWFWDRLISASMPARRSSTATVWRSARSA